jgi:hypothetical protein
MHARVLLTLFLGWLLFPSVSQAQNTTAAGAENVVPGQQWGLTLTDAANERWYRFTAYAGRSYCVETGPYEWSTAANGGADTLIHVRKADTTTNLSTSDTTTHEPRSGSLAFGLSRACFIAPETEQVHVRFMDWLSGTNSYSARVVESTLFSPWFFVGGDYNAFTVLRNTTNATISFTINWRNSAGTIVHSVSSTLPANGGTFYGARSFAGVVGAVSGTIDIAFNGSPQALMANTTVMSATTGLSFDAGFSQRVPW